MFMDPDYNILAEYLKIMGTLHEVKQARKVGEAMTFTGAKVP
jgi:hypothetical protein